MKTFLFAWNPNKWVWKDLDKKIESIQHTGSAIEKWSCRSYKMVKPGDRAFLMVLGQAKRGIIGSGYIKTTPFLSRHWDGSDKLVHRVMIDFEILIDPFKANILSQSALKLKIKSNQEWSPQSSGISLQKEVIDALEKLWFEFNGGFYSAFTETITMGPIGSIYYEGIPYQVTLTRYERNPYARKVCLDYYGLSCFICNFNFGSTYGKYAKDIIHVHHLENIAAKSKNYNIDPITDLRPVCPNCHSVIHHHKKNQLSIEEVKVLLQIHN